MNITNENLFQGDWSAADRAVFLRSVPKAKTVKKGALAVGLPARGVHGHDVSIMDRRSVKAQLAGKGDFRAAWWNLNQRVHALLRPHDGLDTAMCHFHKRHHAVTLGWLSLLQTYLETFKAIQQGGTVAGIRYALSYMRDGSKDTQGAA